MSRDTPSLSLLITGLYTEDPVESSLECLGLVSSQDKTSCDPKTNTENASYFLDCQKVGNDPSEK